VQRTVVFTLMLIFYTSILNTIASQYVVDATQIRYNFHKIQFYVSLQVHLNVHTEYGDILGYQTDLARVFF
jgi:hypothetical protein